MKIVCAIVSMLIVTLSLGCKKGIPVTCDDKFKDMKAENREIGSSFTITCPAGCTTGTVWGTDVYTTDSPLCKSAVHAGIIKASAGGNVKVSVVKSLPSYKGSDRNGIQTSDWSSSWGDRAYTVSK